MFLLCLDTCLARCSAALFDATHSVVVAERQASMETGHAEALAPMIAEVLAEAGMPASGLGGVAVTLGPGTFTGVRIGLAWAQGFAAAAGLPLTGLSSMQATAAPLLHQGHSVSVCHRAGATGKVYVQHFASDGAALSGILLQSPEEIVLPPGSVVAGTGSMATARGFELPVAARFASYASALEAATTAVQPIYVREPDVKRPAQAPVSTPQVSRVGADHAEVLAVLHAASFDAGWPAPDLAAMLDVPGTLALLARLKDEPCGFILARAVAGEAEVLTLATLPAMRRKGIARSLLQSVAGYLTALQAPVLFLEVAADNEAALKLYEGAGFRAAGRRRDYYKRPGGAVDAIVMRRGG